MEEVKAMLTQLRLEQYAAAFDEMGYDDLSYLQSLTPGEIAEVAANVAMKPGHAQKLLMLMPQYRPA